MDCPKCGANLATDALFCTNCGTKIAQPKKVCPNCGARMKEDALFCEVCGTRIENISIPAPNYEEQATKREEIGRINTVAVEKTPALEIAQNIQQTKRNSFAAKKSTIAIVGAILLLVVSSFFIYPKAKALYATRIYEKGMAFYYAKDYKIALPYIQKSAKYGNSDAMFTIGQMYSYGYGVKRDVSVAVNWFKQAAENDNVEAMKELGYLYLYGQSGVCAADETEAKKWYNRAIMKYTAEAEKGNSDAMCHLGEMYQNGQGVEENFREALKWYKKAADNGNITGMFCVAVLYDPDFYTADLRDQIGENEEESIIWYKKAAEAGDLLSMRILVDYYSRIDNNNAEESSKWSKKLSEKLLSSKTAGNCKLSVAQEIHTVEDRLYTSWQTTSDSYTANREEMYGEFLDAELDCIYNKLKASLSKDKKKALDVEQQKWIKRREEKAIAAAKEFEGGTLAGAEYASTYNMETQERILYLADYYDKLTNGKKD